METVTVTQAAEELGVSSQQVINLIKRNKLEAEKKGWFWLITQDSVKARKHAIN